MKFKLKGIIDGLNYKKGAVRLILKFSGLEMPNVVNILSLVNETFDITLAKKVEDVVIKIKIKNVLYDGLSFGKEANSILKLDIDPSQIPSLEDLYKFNDLVAILVEK